MGILCSVDHGLVPYLGGEQKEEASPLGYTCLDLLTQQWAASSKRRNTCSSWEEMTLLEAWGRWNPIACIDCDCEMVTLFALSEVLYILEADFLHLLFVCEAICSWRLCFHFPASQS